MWEALFPDAASVTGVVPFQRCALQRSEQKQATKKVKMHAHALKSHLHRPSDSQAVRAVAPEFQVVCIGTHDLPGPVDISGVPKRGDACAPSITYPMDFRVLGLRAGTQAASANAVAQAAADGLVTDVNAMLDRVNAEINSTLAKQRAEGERRLDEAHARAMAEVAALTAALRRQGVQI